MNTECVDALLDEAVAAYPEVLNVSEGLRHDLEQMDLLPGTRLELQSLLGEYESRDRMHLELVHYAERLKGVILQMNAHGFPELPFREFPQEAYDDIRQNMQAIESAGKQIHKKSVTSVGRATIGPEERITP